MRRITKIEPTEPILPRRKRVAAYARVSMESDRLAHSLQRRSVTTATSFRRILNGNMPECMLTVSFPARKPASGRSSSGCWQTVMQER